jgi:hypothetical protein
MGLFDRFKKKPEYDVTNIRVTDIQMGFIFDYDLKSWEVVEEYEYDWGDEYFTREFKIQSADGVAFLSIEEDDEIDIIVSKKVRAQSVSAEVLERIGNEERPPREFVYEGETYFFESETSGYFNDKKKGDKSWVEFIGFNYETKSGEKVITIEQWDENEFEASQGVRINDYEISNILPK